MTIMGGGATQEGGPIQALGPPYCHRSPLSEQSRNLVSLSRAPHALSLISEDAAFAHLDGTLLLLDDNFAWYLLV